MKVDDALGLREWDDYAAASRRASDLSEDDTIPLSTRCEAHLQAKYAYDRFTRAITAKDRAAKARLSVEGVTLFATVLACVGLVVPALATMPLWAGFVGGASCGACLTFWTLSWWPRYRSARGTV